MNLFDMLNNFYDFREIKVVGKANHKIINFKVNSKDWDYYWYDYISPDSDTVILFYSGDTIPNSIIRKSAPIEMIVSYNLRNMYKKA